MGSPDLNSTDSGRGLGLGFEDRTMIRLSGRGRLIVFQVVWPMIRVPYSLVFFTKKRLSSLDVHKASSVVWRAMKPSALMAAKRMTCIEGVYNPVAGRRRGL